MMYIAFIAVMLGAAGVIGGIEAGNNMGTVAAAATYIGGVAYMAAGIRKGRHDDRD